MIKYLGLVFLVACSGNDFSAVGSQINTSAKLKVKLTEVAKGFKQITDIQFVPGDDDQALVLEKAGKLILFNFKTKAKVQLAKFDVPTRSELGLLGLAFHPKFKSNRKLYLNLNKARSRDLFTHIKEFVWKKGATKLSGERLLMEVEQPYVNHDAGQLAFGPDGFLYIGMGDGGSANDPLGHGQNLKTLLGAMLRIDVNKKDSGKEYAIPKDNPFVGKPKVKPEIWAYGLRNPWRYSFEGGRLVVADVGQNAFEEISILEKGGNYGWKLLEGRNCLSTKAKCKALKAKQPVFTYGRSDGLSITGGYVYNGSKFPALKGKYIFADFVSRNAWAITLPKTNETNTDVSAVSLGRWNATVSTFGRNGKGDVFAADYYGGSIYRIDKP